MKYWQKDEKRKISIKGEGYKLKGMQKVL